MAIGLIGKKCGMTRIFTPEGASIPVTVIEVTSNRVTQIKTEETDGYEAVQVTTGHRNNKKGELKASKINAAQKGLFAKANVDAGRGLWEFRVTTEQLADIEVGQEILADSFEVGAVVDVTGKSKGKGFQGPVKRHNFSMQDATHGNSVSHRAHGSTGQNQTPGRVFKGKKMAGQMGNKQVTVQGLEIISIDTENNIIAVQGAIPGANGGNVILRPSNKA